MKSYNQTCAIARALDTIGDRWTLLVLRELLLQGPCRYTDVANGLPGIATSVLADRLRSLEEAGLISRELAPPPVATTLFHLTDQGRAVEPILVALARWGADNADAPGPDAEFRSHWFPFAASAYLRDHTSEGLSVVIQLETPIGTGVIAVTEDGVQTRVGQDASADITIKGTPWTILDLLSGKTTLPQARRQGLSVEGNDAILADFPGIGTT